MAGGSDGHVLVRRGKAQVVEYHFLDVKILFYLYYSPTYFLFRLMLLNQKGEAMYGPYNRSFVALPELEYVQF